MIITHYKSAIIALTTTVFDDEWLDPSNCIILQCNQNKLNEYVVRWCYPIYVHKEFIFFIVHVLICIRTYVNKCVL